VRRAVFSEPVLAHPAEIGGVDATWHAQPGDEAERDQHDGDTDDEQHYGSRRIQVGAIAYLKVESGRPGDAARLAIVHVSSHSRQRHKVVTVMVLASVSTHLPRQNGHVVGRVTGSLNRDSNIVAIFPSCASAAHR
jgi:hypothetical protein